MIVDCHTHIFSSEVIARREEYAAADPCFAMLYGSAKVKMRNAEDLVREMGRRGIDKALILNIGWASHELCLSTNDYLLESAARYPGRLLPFIAVQPQGGKAAAAEISRCAAAGAIGVGELRPDPSILAPAERRSINPVINAVMEHDMTLMLHADEPVGHHYPGKGSLTPEMLYPFILGNPELKLILSHWGGGLPFYTLMPEVKKALRNVWFDSAASPFLYRAEVYERAVDLVGNEKILFGSDWPLLDQRRCLAELDELNLSRWSINRIRGGNAAELFELADE